MYDAIIIGARCAGSPTGMLLARDGYRVLVIDRAKFPSDTLSTHFITPDGVAKLKEWGIFDRVAATGAPINHGIARTFGPLQMPADPGDGASFAPRRTVLDHILVEAAREAGAEVREGVILESLLVEDGVVTGIRARKGDDRFEERGRVVIGADGRDSLVARAVSADVYNETPGATSGYYAYYKNFEHNGPEFYLGGGTAQFVFPTNDGEVCLASEFLTERFPNFRDDIQNGLANLFASNPGVAERFQKAERTSKVFGIVGHKGHYRKPFGPGWALVGDAGYYRDPLLGQGINDAFRDASLLAAALGATWAGGERWEEALGRYEQARNEATMMVYGLTTLLCSTLDPTAETLAMMAGGPPPKPAGVG